jgi:hypothetical protein
MFSTSGNDLLGGVEGEPKLVAARNRMALRLGLQKRRVSGACRSGRLKIEKRSYWRSLL